METQIQLEVIESPGIFTMDESDIIVSSLIKL